MAQNPLQQYFRQPKIFLKLPSGGTYNAVGVTQGNIESMPIFGMTGMDEIIMKTPDALLNSEATVKLIQSCCPTIVDAWHLSALDVPAILLAIRIATYGNSMPVTSICPHCKTENTYDVNLNKLLEHFNNLEFTSKVVLKDIVAHLKPLTYKENVKFALENFAFQRKAMQLLELEKTNSEADVNGMLAKEIEQMNLLQSKLIVDQIDSIETPEQVVNEREYINEFIANVEASTTSRIKDQIAENNEKWSVPPIKGECDNCKGEMQFNVDIDGSSFFATA